jgi:ribonuclease T1
LSYDSLPTLRQNPAKGWGSHKEYSEGKHGPAPGGTTKGKEFLNSAAQLPAKAAGYYREFTVPVAGQAGRGAARLVTGAGGEIYYTADHYVTFTRIK